ncbi:MAG: M20/M25/M40 family metallo-hydrolase [Alphaproteobacteria bacterium]|nr:M20/M25/M40 family metallo-hydrolase [Alphaproteobacteria bacterium]MCB9793870.1 M20/M25/M40 family metallo-hydrolase [Alphaproteobacteria bacterium]
MSHPAVEEVASLADNRFEQTLSRLSEYLAIPAISCEEAHADDVRRLAQRVRDDLEALGLEKAEVLELPGALPMVAAEWMKAGKDAPTVLIYGHLDLQPVMVENWRTPPHEAHQVGDRLYARGSADDMGGWVSHVAALEAWFAVAGELPCNVRLIIEGEEEIGSPNLERYMDAFKDRFEADAMVLTDCENPSVDVPGLTVSLRGLLEVRLECEALEADGHSGLWGNMVPDVTTALIKLIGRLVDDDGRTTFGRVTLSEEEVAALATVPNEVIRDGAHLLEGVDPLPLRGRSAAEWLWRQPALTVVSTTLPSPSQKKNALRAKAGAVLSVRLGPGQTPDVVYKEIKDILLSKPQGGVKVSVSAPGDWGGAWLYTPKGPAFEAADRAYVKSWGKPLERIGVGGSIPFVAIFGERFGDLPLILNGVMDPRTTAHGPNESMHLGVFRKAIAANVYLLDELGALGVALAAK